MYPKTIKNLIEIFSRFPGVGKKTATRFSLFLLKEGKEKIKDFIENLEKILTSVKFCEFCFKPFEGEGKLCEICKNPARDESKLCVVEKEEDLEAIEENGVYNGLYFILGGPISSVTKEQLKKLRIEELLERVKSPRNFGIFSDFKEIILALNFTFEGEAIGIYLQKKLKETGKKITRLSKGLPSGGEIEYADKETLESAFEGRR